LFWVTQQAAGSTSSWKTEKHAEFERAGEESDQLGEGNVLEQFVEEELGGRVESSVFCDLLLGEPPTALVTA
jgi:hypothetical protein